MGSINKDATLLGRTYSHNLGGSKAGYVQPHISSSWGQGKTQNLNLASTSVHCEAESSPVPTLCHLDLSWHAADIMGDCSTDQAYCRWLLDPVVSELGEVRSQ